MYMKNDVFTDLYYDNFVQVNPDAYKRLVGELKGIVGSDTKEYSRVVSALKYTYQNHMSADENFNLELINEEFASYTLQHFLDNPKSLKKLAQKDMGKFRRVCNNILGIFDSGISKYSAQDPSAKELFDPIVEKLSDAREKIESVYLEGIGKKNSSGLNSERFLLVGVSADGRKIYKTNYPEGTPKSVKQNDIINLVQNIWSKKPVTLTVYENGVPKQIKAHFNPELSDRSNLSKIAFGNRKGNASEKRMTLDLSSDLYQIASDSKFTFGKDESGKDNPAHEDVSYWNYFVTDLIYENNDGSQIDCYMNIDVKKRNDGNYFYSFHIKRGTAPQTLDAVVSNEMLPTVPNNIIHHKDDIVKENIKSDRVNLYDCQ